MNEENALVVEGTGEPGKLYEVEGSFNLQDWIYTGRVIALDGNIAITDEKHAEHEEELSGESSKRIFYRLKIPE